MNCQQARNLFDAYLNGELSDGLATELAAHRLQCSACRHELALLEVAGHVMSADPDDPTPPADFTRRLMACLEAPRPVPLYRRAKLIWAAGSVMAAAACIAFVVTLHSGPEERVKGARQEYNGPVTTPEANGAPRKAAADLDAVTEAFQRRLEQETLNTHKAVHSLEQAGRRTILNTIEALQAKPGAEGVDQLEPPAEGAHAPDDTRTAPDVEDDADQIEDL
jgi:hypothetical protein